MEGEPLRRADPLRITAVLKSSQRCAVRVVLSCEAMDAERSRGKLIARLLGESLREIAILVAVFAPLDALMQGAALTSWSWVAIIVVVATFFVVGVYLETR